MSFWQWRLFLLSFTLTLLLIATLCGFVMVDHAADQYGFGGIISTLEVEKRGELEYEVSVRGWKRHVDLEPLNQMVGFEHRYDAYLAPRSLRVMGKLAALAAQTYQNLHDARLEREFERITADES